MYLKDQSPRIIDQFREHYRLLGLNSYDGWDQLRRTYKKQMWRWHPDRFGNNESERLQAEDRAKEINQAYQALADYYTTHGRMPVEVPSSGKHDSPTKPDVRYSPPSSSSTEPKAPRSDPADAPSVPLRRAIILSIAIIAAYLLAEQMIVPPNKIQTVPPQPEDQSPSATATGTDHAPAFGTGSTVSEVYATQGVPDRVSGEVWHYGEARVHFAQGRVTHWKDDGGRLKARNNTKSSATVDRPFFGKGSTKDEVRAAQGTPLRESGNVWDYGLSRVLFDNNELVIGWEESPLDPLRVRR